MKKPATPKPTRISTVTVSCGNVSYQATATDRLEALGAILEAVLAEQTASK